MKKIIPIVTILGISSLLSGCKDKLNTSKNNIANNINSFSKSFNSYSNLNQPQHLKTCLNKYKLSIDNDLTTLENFDESVKIQENLNTNNNLPIEENSEEDIEKDMEDNSHTEKENELSDNISTFYSLSEDIENSCNEFCQLKKDITNAIIETQNLISKIQGKDINLTRQQRMFITEQSTQLKHLGKQLSNITTELSFNLSDLNQIITMNNQDIDNLSFKYLLVLDNLVNGNEMLQSGMQSLNLINQMFNIPKNTVESNNLNKILYGFKRNDEPAIIKEYALNNNGEIEEIVNDSSSSHITKDIKDEDIVSTETNKNATQEVSKQDKKLNIDTYKNNNLSSNIDSYQTQNPPKNIDSFFNTALLDNEFMFGNNYGYNYSINNGYRGFNPHYNNYNYNNTNSENNHNNTQHIDNNSNLATENKDKKKFKLNKNIDTYEDENEPHIKVKIAKIKNGIQKFFTGFKKSDLSDKAENPIYKLDR